MEPFIPIEAVIKLSNSNRSKLSLLIENHFLNLIYHEDYICKVLEEILIYDKLKERVYLDVSVIERASCDL